MTLTASGSVRAETPRSIGCGGEIFSRSYFVGLEAFAVRTIPRVLVRGRQANA